jgi:alkylation response protein AidB-like acyl-CoA dehydrogenase
MGFLGVAIPEEFGGAGAGHLELCVIAEEIGRALAPVPFSSTIYLAAEALMLAGSDAQKAKWLPKIAAGEAIGTLALFEGTGNPSHKAIKVSASQGAVSGTKIPVADGAIADFVIVAARTGSTGREADIGLFIVDLNGDGVTRKALTNLDQAHGQAEITFDRAKAEPLGAAHEGWNTLTRVLDRAAVLMAFEQVGGADRALEMGRDYALDRVAFGRPIGSFQAVKHILADMYVSATLARPIATTAHGRFRPMRLNCGGSSDRAHQRHAGLPALRQEQHSGAWRHGLHLGVRLPPLLPARQCARAAARKRDLLGEPVDRSPALQERELRTPSFRGARLRANPESS